MNNIKVRLTKRCGVNVFLTEEQKALCRTQKNGAKYSDRGALKCAKNCAAYRKRECPVLKAFDKLACYEDLEAEGKVAEVKRGKWFIDDFPKQNKKFLICSECRAVIDCNVNFIDENEYDFCPYCGAKMDLNGGADNAV